jgi:hypothetical protein
MRATLKCPFRASVLVSEGNLQVKHFLTGALEAEVARFNDAGVHGTHRDFVYLASLDTEERAVGRGVIPRASHRLEPWVPVRQHAVLFPDLPLEEMRLRLRHGQR